MQELDRLARITAPCGVEVRRGVHSDFVQHDDGRLRNGAPPLHNLSEVLHVTDLAGDGDALAVDSAAYAEVRQRVGAGVELVAVNKVRSDNSSCPPLASLTVDGCHVPVVGGEEVVDVLADL